MKNKMSALLMKAVINDEFGSPDVLRLREIERPAIGDDGVLVRVRAASVNPLDWHFVRGEPYFARLVGVGLRRPKSAVRGVDVAGVVERVGATVSDLRPGDEVFGTCGGAFAEYARGRVVRLAPKPAGLTFEQAAAIPIAGVTALQGLRDKGRLEPGQRVLINGAAGGVGTFAVQIAKAFGAEVTGVCSTRNVELVRSIGADHVIDYTGDDFTRIRERYDLVVDNVGNRPLRHLRRIVIPGGKLILAAGGRGRWVEPLPTMLKTFVYSRFVSQEVIKFFANIRGDDLLALKDMIETGKIMPVIDRTYPLNEVPDAIRYLETGHARGKVVITL
jgi:NADPH:quinone reductase-like Zn-dependent oxidoreductase